jgi:hypothetical protein
MTTLPIFQENISTHEIALAIARNYLGLQLPVRVLLDSLDIDEQILATLLKNTEFTKLIRKYKRELEEDGEGIRLKSAIALEDCIGRMHGLIHDVETPPNVVVQGFKVLSETAGVNKGRQEGASGPGFSINIDLSGLKEVQERKILGVDNE